MYATTPLWKPFLHTFMTDKSLFGLPVFWIPLPIHFGYLIGCVQGSEHSINKLNISTSLQHNTEILVTFVSNLSGEKI